MNWRKPDEDDLTATLSQAEIEAFRRSASFAADPVERILQRTSALVRGFIATNGKVRRMGPAGTLPESLVSPAMDYAAYDILKRMPVALTDERRTARAKAEELFRDVAQGRFTPESDESDGTSSTDGPAIEVVATSRSRVTPAKLEGL